MIGYSLVSRLRQFLSWLYYEHQWEKWEVLTIGVVVLIVLLLIIRRQRKRAIRRVYANHLPERSPVIGSNLGDRKRSHHRIKDLKKSRLTFVPERPEKHNKPKKRTEQPEKLPEQIKQLQYEIVKRKQAETRLDQRVANLTADNEQLRREIAESRQVEQRSGREVAKTPAADEKLQPEVVEKKQAEQDIEEQAAETLAEKKPPKKKTARSGSKYEDFHRVVDEVKQKLCRKCNEWKPESEFHKNASCKDGLAGSCKVCKANAARLYRERWKGEKNNDQ